MDLRTRYKAEGVTGCDMAATNRILSLLTTPPYKHLPHERRQEPPPSIAQPLAAEIVADNHAHASLGGMRPKKCWLVDADAAPRNATRACCARAASGHAAAPPRSVMKSRRFIQ